MADNLPPPTATAKLLQSTTIQKVRLYGADPAIIKALANTGIGIVIGAANGDIPPLASDPNVAGQWVNANVLPYYPASKIIVITVGNEVMSSGDQNLISQILPAMKNVQNALNAGPYFHRPVPFSSHNYFDFFFSSFFVHLKKGKRQCKQCSFTGRENQGFNCTFDGCVISIGPAIIWSF